MKHKVKYAGIAVMESDNIKKLSFHTSGAIDRPVGLWMKVPGRALFNFIKLPRTFSKINALRYLLQHKDFKLPMYQKFLRDQIERRINGETINPRQGMPIRRNGHRLPPQILRSRSSVTDQHQRGRPIPVFLFFFVHTTPPFFAHINVGYLT